MPLARIDFSRARRLCTAQEWRLVQTARRDPLARLTIAQLRQSIVRARKLRDKWRDQTTRQHRRSQQKKGARGVSAPQRSPEKHELFAAAMDRFESELARRSAQSSGGNQPKPVKKPGSRAAKVVTVGSSPSAKATPTSMPTPDPGLSISRGKQRRATTAAKQAKIRKTGLKSRVRGHVSARGRRTQAKRDARN